LRSYLRRSRERALSAVGRNLRFIRKKDALSRRRWGRIRLVLQPAEDLGAAEVVAGVAVIVAGLDALHAREQRARLDLGTELAAPALTTRQLQIMSLGT
jgi:hypothetical protein